MDKATTGLRIKAARQLADLTVVELADRLDLPGLGAKTIGNIERGSRELRPHEVAPIARALNVPETFLNGENPAGRDEIMDRLDAIDARLQAMHAMLVDGQDVIDRLDRLEEALGARTDAVIPGVRELLEAIESDLAATPSRSARKGNPGASSPRPRQRRVEVR